MYLTGRQPRQPFETRKRVDALVKKFDRQYIQNTADRFRFLTIQTRYAKLCELWERQLNNHDFGKPKRGATFSSAPVREPRAEDRPAAAAAKAAEPKEPRREAGARGEFPRSRRRSRARAGVYSARRTRARKRRSAAGVDRVAALVKAQVQSTAPTCTEVAFRRGHERTERCR
jgi:hypothetical protein